jgi:CCR4-NOT transcription complex subunit 1
VIATLIQYEIIPAEEYDTQLAKLIYNKVDDAAVFAIDLVQLCLLADRPITLLEDHALTITALRQQTLPDSKLSTRYKKKRAHSSSPLC